MKNDSGTAVRLITVIVPVHNGEKFLRDALASIYAQDYRPIEVIVIDDGSTDGSGAIARSFPEVRYVYQEQQGSAAARNSGLTICKGEFIAFLDADDLWLPSQLSIQANYLAMHPEAGGVRGMMKNFLEAGIRCPPWIDPSTLLQPSDVVSLGTLLARRSLIEAVGKFNPAYLQGEDLEWFFRVDRKSVV